MALAMQIAPTDVDAVLAACARVYETRRQAVEELEVAERWDGTAHVLVIRELGRVECVLDHDADPTVYPAVVSDLARAGWEVWALIPTEQMGAAHRALRGAPVMLQPWWMTGDHVHFGRPEIP